MKKSLLSFVVITRLTLCPDQAAPLGTAFTYQGRLTDDGNPANQIYDFRFALYDAPADGIQMGNAITNASVSVSNGLFTLSLDFGATVFADASLWLEIAVRPAASTNNFVPLTPRQPLTPTPYALFAPTAATATTANSVAASSVSAPQLNTGGTPVGGQVLAFNGTSLSWTNAASVAWTPNGNAGTTPGVNFLGTTDNQPLELWVNNARALRLEPNATAPNLIGGHSANSASAGAVGITIGGGGQSGAVNRVSDNFGTVGGGYNNQAGNSAGTSTDSECATVGGGVGNMAGGLLSTIGGGTGNEIGATAALATISGGGYSSISSNADNATISGGGFHEIWMDSHSSTIGGGLRNIIRNHSALSTIGGGENNWVETDAGLATICGGTRNSILTFAFGATIGGGAFNTVQIQTAGATIGGGNRNTVQSNSAFATISGGFTNWVGPNAWAPTVGGGESNVARGTNSTVPGGLLNVAGGNYSFAAGRRAKAVQLGAFVWADASDIDFSSIAANEFAVRATGGVRLVSSIDANGAPAAGVSLPTGSGSWNSLSDRNAKTDFARLDPREVLERLADIPIQSWRYKTEAGSIRHIGPTAQDFLAAFNVGEDDRHIATVDADGVALAAIQGLNRKLEEEIKAKETKIAALEERLAAVEQLLATPISDAGGLTPR